MGNIKEPRDYGPPVQQLKNGKTFNLTDVLSQARTQYMQTRRLFNLGQRIKKSGRPKQIPLPKTQRPKKSKYSREDTLWMIDHSAREIAEKFDVSVPQAYAIKHYARSVHF